jgi:2-(1,2-epoxy-1,2-dihydrophenyl)acetyl-CoA isomerase
MDSAKVILSKNDGIAFIILNDPKNRNVLSAATAELLANFLDECEYDPEVRVVVLRGAGATFSAGGNINPCWIAWTPVRRTTGRE